MKSDYATFFQRFLAFCLDSIIMLFCSVPFYFLLKNTSNSVTFNQATLLPRLLLTIAYNTYMISHGGATFGKRALKIQVQRENGGSLTIGQAFLREFLGKSIMGTLLIGYVWMLFDRKKQGWQDKIAETIVISI